jgi:peptidase E
MVDVEGGWTHCLLLLFFERWRIEMVYRKRLRRGPLLVGAL